MLKDNSIVNAMFDIVPTPRREITWSDNHNKIKVLTSLYIHCMATPGHGLLCFIISVRGKI